jgi:site-specific DNA-methyltransferase (adenine-specific)
MATFNKYCERYELHREDKPCMTQCDLCYSVETTPKKPFKRPNIHLIKGDALEEMQRLNDFGVIVDMILCDLPYGTTSNKWDSVIAFEPMWELFWKLLKPNGVVVLTASQPFSSALIMSQPKHFKHEWIWLKNRGSNFANTVREPMKEHEQVLVFSKGKWTYNKQMQERTGTGIDRVKYNVKFESKSENYREFEGRNKNQLSDLRVPSSWQKFNTDTSGLHPTIKPIPLFEYLINTYTNENEIVLDCTMGSGTTAIACLNTNRQFFGIELEEKYFETAKKRVDEKIKEQENKQLEIF